MGNGVALSPVGWIRVVAFGRNPAWTLVRVGVLILATVVVFNYVVALRKIESISMLPTFREGSIHLLNRLAYVGGRQPARGDIVGIRTSGETVMYIKRIIGLPGETIAIRDGTVLINGEPLDEPYVRLRRRPWNRPPRVLAPGEYYLIGDNRSMSQDQHEFGAVDGRRVMGKVVW